MITHQLFTKPYLNHFPKLKLRNNKIWELHKKGWSPTEIRRYLEKNGYKVSKYPLSINNIIQIRIKKEKELDQSIELDTFVNFGMEMIRS